MDIWKHGKYVDTWSIVHFFSGIVIAGGLFGLGYSFLPALLISIAIIVVWELFEWFAGIIEPGPNVVVDLLVGGIGFLLGSYYYYMVATELDALTFGILCGITLVLSLWGFFDFIKRGYR